MRNARGVRIRFIAKMNLTTKTCGARLLRAAALMPAFLPVAATLIAAENNDAPPPAQNRPSEAAKTKEGSVKPGEPSGTDRLEKVVVIASGRREKLSDVSPSVSVVTRDEIETRRLTSLSDALGQSPGVIVATTGAPGGNQSVFTRGTNSNMTALLLDGRRVNPGFSNSGEIERFSLTGVDSVEFLRGASSTLYGANALGGVIGMRTTDTLALERNEGMLFGEIGRFGHSDFGVQAAGNTDTAGEGALVKGLGASVAYSQMQTDNNRVNNDFSRKNLLQKTEYRICDTLSLELLNQYYETQAGVPGSLAFPSATQRLDRSGWMTSPGVKFDNHDGVRASTFYAYSFARLDSYGSAFGAPTRSEIDMQEVNSQVEFDITRHALLTLGYAYENTAFDRENRATGAELAGSPKWESHSPWARAEFFSKDKAARFGLGGRYQHFDAFDDALTGEVFGSYKFRETGTLLSAKVASAYAAPAASYYQNAPLSELKPEESLSWEAGVRQELFMKSVPTEIGAVYFENRMDNVISTRDTGGFVYRAFNALEARARGVELFVEARPVRQVKLFANATIQDARYTADQTQFGITAGDKLLRRPDYMTTFGVEVYPVEDVTLGVSGTGVMGREDFGHVDQGDYFVARAYAGWRFVKNAEVFGRVENIFDEKYDSAGIGYPALPLAAYAGIRARF